MKPRTRARLERDRARRESFAPLWSAPPRLARVFALAGVTCDRDASIPRGALVLALEARNGDVEISWKPLARGVEDLAGYPGGRPFLAAIADAERIREENDGDVVILVVMHDGLYRAGAFKTRRSVPSVNTWGGERGIA